MKKVFLIILFAFTVSIFGYIIINKMTQKTEEIPNVEMNDQDKTKQIAINTDNDSYTLDVEIAKTEEALQRGLMGRTSLAENSGMLFVFNTENIRSFWMKDTLISLDIIFIASDGTIVNIARNTKTNQTEELYPSKKPVLYVLEVNGGWCSTHNITNGDKVILYEILKNE